MADATAVSTGAWSSGFWDCFQDCDSFCCAVWCPCVIVGRLLEIIDQGVTSCMTAGCVYFWYHGCTGCGFLYTYSYRAKLRAKYGLAAGPCGDPSSDCCADFWCPACSYAQQYRELQASGVDPALGWEANQVVYEQSAPAQQKMSQF